MMAENVVQAEGRPSHIESLELTRSQGYLVGPLVNTWEEFRREHSIYIINVMAVIKSKYRFMSFITRHCKHPC